MSEIYLVGGTTPRTDLDNYVSANINKENAIKSLEYWEKEQGEYDDFHIDHIEIDDLAEHDSKIRAEVFQEIESAMYHQCFECDNNEDMQKWDGGNWIRYKLFENVMDKLKEKKNNGCD